VEFKSEYRASDKWSEATDIVDETTGNFNNFHISETTQSKLKAKGIPFLFPVQMSTFNSIYDGRDVIVQARTGSGKTLSYALPLIERLHETVNQQSRRSPQLLVMTPTRELAHQVSDVIASLSDNLSVVSIYGGAPISVQETKLRSGVDVVVGTPGRIADFLERGTLDLSQLRHVVLDEVDRMLDMGFADSVDDILKHRYTPGSPDNNPQTLLFSATIPSWVQNTARKYLRSDIVKLDLVGKGTIRTATSVEHLAVSCSLRDRTVIIANMLQVYSGAHGRAIIFCETKRDADMLATSNAIRVETHVLHGDIPQDKREMVLKGFRDGRYRCLIATDVAARGLDIPEVDLVIQCSPPKDVDSYIHRSGRTGRAGRAGVSVLLYRPADLHDVTNVEKIAGIKFKRIRPPSADVLAAAAAEDVAKSLDCVSKSAVERFMKTAEDVAARHGAIPALAAAIAVLSGNDKPISLLTATPGFTTYMLQSKSDMRKLSHAWQTLEQLVPAEIKNQATSMRLCADHSGCVFDLPSQCDTSLADSDVLVRLNELPELEEQQNFVEHRHNAGHRRTGEWVGGTSGYAARGTPKDRSRTSSWHHSPPGGGRHSNFQPYGTPRPDGRVPPYNAKRTRDTRFSGLEEE
jgi:ATP-dependent RNA helicase DDX21